MGPASLLLAWAIGWPWLRASSACGGLRPRWAAWAVEALLALALGLGATATLFFALLWGGLAPRPAALVADAVLALGGLLAWGASRMVRKQELADPPAEAPRFEWQWLVLVVSAAALLLFVVAHIATSRANPQGGWDAWAVWNLRAKFLVPPRSLAHGRGSCHEHDAPGGARLLWPARHRPWLALRSRSRHPGGARGSRSARKHRNHTPSGPGAGRAARARPRRSGRTAAHQRVFALAPVRHAVPRSAARSAAALRPGLGAARRAPPLVGAGTGPERRPGRARRLHQQRRVARLPAARRRGDCAGPALCLGLARRRRPPHCC